jgi:VCBS repeat-containing protein
VATWHCLSEKIVRTIHSFTKNLGTLIVMLTLAGCTTTPTVESEKPLGSTVTKMDGTARFSTDGQNWQSLKRGDIVEEGMTIQTADRSTVDIHLGVKLDLRLEHPGKPPIRNPESSGLSKGEMIRIEPSSVLKIEELKGFHRSYGWFKYPKPTKIRLDLRAGQMMGNLEKSENGHPSEIKFGGNTAIVTFGCHVLSSSGIIYVLSGEVNVAMGSTNATKEVPPRFMFDTNTGKISAIPPPVRTIPDSQGPDL